MGKRAFAICAPFVGQTEAPSSNWRAEKAKRFFFFCQLWPRELFSDFAAFFSAAILLWREQEIELFNFYNELCYISLRFN